MKIRVEVTQEDIEQGIRSSARNCPVALAVKRAVGHDRVGVTHHITTVFQSTGHMVSTVNSVEVKMWISSYDLWGYRKTKKFFGFTILKANLKPFSFEIELPYNVLEEAALVAAKARSQSQVWSRIER